MPEHLVFHTTATPAETADALESMLVRRGTWYMPMLSNPQFRGYVDDDGFEWTQLQSMSAISTGGGRGHWMVTFSPRTIRGTIRRVPTGTRVEVTIWNSPWVWIPGVITSGMTLVPALALAVTVGTQAGLVPCCFFGFFFLSVSMLVWSLVSNAVGGRRVRERLRDLIENAGPPPERTQPRPVEEQPVRPPTRPAPRILDALPVADPPILNALPVEDPPAPQTPPPQQQGGLDEWRYR